MSDLMTVYQLGPQLQALLGLPKHVRSFELRCAVDEIVTVKCEYYPEVTSIEPVLAEYELVPRKSTSAPADDSITGGRHFDVWMRERTEAAHAEFMARLPPDPRYTFKINPDGYVVGFGTALAPQ